MSCATVDRGWDHLALELCDRADRSAEELMAGSSDMPEWLFSAYILMVVLVLALTVAFILGMEALAYRIWLVGLVTAVVFEAGLQSVREPVPCEEGHERGYVLSWNGVPGDDDGRLRRFLSEEMDVDWADRAAVERSDDDTILVSSGDAWARLILGRNDGRALIVTSDRRTRYLAAREEDGAFDLYSPDNRTKRRFLVYALCMWGTFWLGFFSIMVLGVDLTSTIAGRLAFVVAYLKLYPIIDEQTVPMLLGEVAEWTDEDLALAGMCWERPIKPIYAERPYEERAFELAEGGRHRRAVVQRGRGGGREGERGVIRWRSAGGGSSGGSS